MRLFGRKQSEEDQAVSWDSGDDEPVRELDTPAK